MLIPCCVLGKSAVCLWKVQPAPLQIDGLFGNPPKGLSSPPLSGFGCPDQDSHSGMKEICLAQVGSPPCPGGHPMSSTWSEEWGVLQREIEDLLPKRRGRGCWAGNPRCLPQTLS